MRFQEVMQDEPVRVPERVLAVASGQGAQLRDVAVVGRYYDGSIEVLRSSMPPEELRALAAALNAHANRAVMRADAAGSRPKPLSAAAETLRLADQLLTAEGLERAILRAEASDRAAPPDLKDYYDPVLKERVLVAADQALKSALEKDPVASKAFDRWLAGCQDALGELRPAREEITPEPKAAAADRPQEVVEEISPQPEEDPRVKPEDDGVVGVKPAVRPVEGIEDAMAIAAADRAINPPLVRMVDDEKVRSLEVAAASLSGSAEKLLAGSKKLLRPGMWQRVTNVQLARAAGVSDPMVPHLLAELKSAGLIEVQGATSARLLRLPDGVAWSPLEPPVVAAALSEPERADRAARGPGQVIRTAPAPVLRDGLRPPQDEGGESTAGDDGVSPVAAVPAPFVSAAERAEREAIEAHIRTKGVSTRVDYGPDGPAVEWLKARAFEVFRTPPEQKGLQGWRINWGQVITSKGLWEYAAKEAARRGEPGPQRLEPVTAGPARRQVRRAG